MADTVELRAIDGDLATVTGGSWSENLGTAGVLGTATALVSGLGTRSMFNHMARIPGISRRLPPGSIDAVKGIAYKYVVPTTFAAGAIAGSAIDGIAQGVRKITG